jgi:2-polyprenyl-3-methyl-5-hydroxy-6-metoxy-1,4-benzoquinol methylase
MSTKPGPVLRTESKPVCPVCAGPGTELYRALHDHLIGVAGNWTLRRCERGGCGLLWLDPAPLEQDLALAYAGYYTHAAQAPKRDGALRQAWTVLKEGYYARRFGYRVPGRVWKQAVSAVLLAPFPTWRETFDILALELPPVPNGRVLEVGCGAGNSLLTLQGLGWQTQGIDFDMGAVRAARERGLSVSEGGLAEQAYPDATFDAVAMVHVIEHVPDPVAVLIETRRVLRPGGRLVLITPNSAGRGHRRFGRAWRGLEPPRHVQVFNRASLLRAVEAAGFADIELRSTARMASMIHQESRGIAGARVGVIDRARAFAFQLRERAALMRDPWAGEELVLVARPEADHAG